MQPIPDHDPFTRQLFSVRSYVARELNLLHRRTCKLKYKIADLEEEAAALGLEIEHISITRRRQDSSRMRSLLANVFSCSREEERVRKRRFDLSDYLLRVAARIEVHYYQTQSAQDLFGGMVDLYDNQLYHLAGLTRYLDRASMDNRKARAQVWFLYGLNYEA